MRRKREATTFISELLLGTQSMRLEFLIGAKTQRQSFSTRSLSQSRSQILVLRQQDMDKCSDYGSLFMPEVRLLMQVGLV